MMKKYGLSDVREAMYRLIRLGMKPERAYELVVQAFPEFRGQLLN